MLFPGNSRPIALKPCAAIESAQSFAGGVFGGAKGKATAQSCGTMTSDQLPIIELWHGRIRRSPTLLRVGALVATEAKVLIDIDRVAEMELPAIEAFAPASPRHTRRPVSWRCERWSRHC